MKKIYFSFVLMLMAAMKMSATVHIITQSNLTFSPALLTVEVGDTVRWEWTNGSHTTTSISVPSGAATWDSPLTMSNDSFEYEVTVAGNYGYKCTPHFAAQMVGAFTAEAANNVQEVTAQPNLTVSMDAQNNQLAVYAVGQATGFTTIQVIDISGKIVATLFSDNAGNEEFVVRKDVSFLQRGIYFVHMKSGDFQMTKKFIKG